MNCIPQSTIVTQKIYITAQKKLNKLVVYMTFFKEK